jgi:hypothetical protein
LSINCKYSKWNDEFKIIKLMFQYGHTHPELKSPQKDRYLAIKRQ